MSVADISLSLKSYNMTIAGMEDNVLGFVDALEMILLYRTPLFLLQEAR